MMPKDLPHWKMVLGEDKPGAGEKKGAQKPVDTLRVICRNARR